MTQCIFKGDTYKFSNNRVHWTKAVFIGKSKNKYMGFALNHNYIEIAPSNKLKAKSYRHILQ